MKTKILFLLSALVLTFSSCEEMIPVVELENFMYISVVGAKEKPAIKKMNLFSNNDTVFPISVAYGGTTNYNHGNIDATIDADLSLVDAYNAENGTYYLAPPVAAYSLDKTAAQIVDGKNSSDVVQLTIKKSALDLSNEYLLPITVKSLTGGDLVLNEEFKTLYIVLTADVDLEAGRDNWTTVDASSEWQGQFFASLAYDNDRGSYWHTELTGLPQWFTVDMANYKRFDGFTLVNRADGDARPKKIKIETSMDNVNWKVAYQTEELPNVATQQSLIFDKSIVARYFKFTAESNWTNAPYTYLSEINIFAGEPPADEIDYEKKTWKIDSFSSEWNEDYGVAKIIDDNVMSAWHTEPFDAAKNGFPQWVIIDMQKVRPALKGLKMYHRQDDTSCEPKDMSFEISDDKETWTVIGEVEIPPLAEGNKKNPEFYEEIDMNNPKGGRYLKININSIWAGNAWSYFSEIYPY